MGIMNAVPIANIIGAELITESPRSLYTVSTVKTVTPEPVYSEGREDELRSKNRILAQNFLDDILKGYNIKLKDVVFSPDLMAVIQGGEVTENGAISGFSSPAAGTEQVKPRFTLRVYSEEKNPDGTSGDCYRFTFPGCVGTDARFSFEDGEFILPEYTVRSRAPFNESCMSIECLGAKPVYIDSAASFPANAENGRLYIAQQHMTVQGEELDAGDGIMRSGTGYQAVKLD